MNKTTAAWPTILIGSLSCFLGTANPLLHLPLLIVLYPATLAYLGLSHQRPFRAGWLTGWLGSSAALYWIAVAVHVYGHYPWSVGVLCVLLLGAYLGLYAGLFAWLLGKLQSLSWRRLTLTGFLLWFLLEWTRNWMLSGFPWLTLASGLAAWPILIQLVSLTGEYMFSGLLAGIGTLLALAILRKKRGEPGPWLPAGLAAGCIALCALFGMARLTMFDGAGSEIRLTMIQGNISQDLKWDPIMQQATVDSYLDLSRNSMIDQAKPDLIIWPETAMPFYYTATPQYDQQLRAFAGINQVSLLFGSPGFTLREGQETKRHNRAFLIDRFGFDNAYYDKEHLVPIGEYLPRILNWEIFSGMLQGLGGFSPGETTELFILYDQAWEPLAKLGLLICYEGIFPELARERVQQGAQVLINISNDAWYDRTAAPVQHLYTSSLRAVEQGRWLARCTNTGVTAFVDPLGRIDALGNVADGSGLFVSAWKNGTVSVLEKKTIFYHLQPLLPGLAFVLLLPIIWPAARIRRENTQGHKSRSKPQN